MRSRATLTIAILASSLNIGDPGLAYELRSHGRLTESAFDASIGVSRYLSDVDLDPQRPLDRQQATPADQLSGFTNRGLPRDWMVEGSIREDDYRSGCQPPLNPPSAIDRPLHHFADVQRGDRGLTVLGATVGLPAPDWALGVQGRGASPSENQYSLLDARIYQLTSLTALNSDERERHTARMFSTLGHVLHLVQDMAQPQHTRNDPHAGCLEFIAGEGSWYEDYIEQRAVGKLFRSRAEPAPPLALGGYTAPVLARARDFFTGPRGLADFSSRNFLSAGTNFTMLSTELRCGGQPDPPCSPNDPLMYTQRRTPFSFVSVDGTRVAGQVTTFHRSAQDPITGVTVPDIAVSSRSVWDQHLESRGLLPVFTLNTLNYDAMSDVLLPRAAGYGAGLLDYFFRGRLDVDLYREPGDASVVRIKGINDSPDAMTAGTLQLYVEGDSGDRVPAMALDDGVATSAAPNASIESGRFQVPAGAERFVAVYSGTLGDEVRDPARNVPGAVVAKRLGGTRVEQVFSDGTRWQLRTPTGIFPLPILAQNVVTLVWGDRDDTLVGATAFNRAGGPNRFHAWRINRSVGDPRVPRTATGEVDVIPLFETSFPFGLDLGTTVRLDHTIRYKKYLPAFLHTEFQDLDGTIQSETLEFTNPLAVDTTGTVSREYRLPLDLDHLDNTEAMPHRWSLQSFGLTEDLRVVALVDVRLIRTGASLSVPQRAYVLPCQSWPCPMQDVPPRPLDATFPDQGAVAIAALIDVTGGRVIASTTPPITRLAHATIVTEVGDRRAGDATVVEARRIIRPDRDTFAVFSPVDNFGNFSVSRCDQFPDVIVIGAIDDYVFGTTATDTSDLTAELEPLNFPPVESVTRTTGRFCVSNFEPRMGRLPLIAVRIDTAQPRHFRGLVREMARARTTPPRLLTTIVQTQQVNPLGTDTRLIVWDPAQGRASVRYDPRDRRGVSVTGMNRSTAVAATLSDLLVVPLDGPPGVRPFSMSATEADDFVPLEPAFLYRTTDATFYRTGATLEATALPLPLAPGGPATGDFHAVRLR